MIVDPPHQLVRIERVGPLTERMAELAAAGSHDAWDRIFRAVYPRLHGFAMRRVGADAADDVVSETMTRAVAGIARFRWTDDGIEPWLFGIARRAAADHHRAEARRRRWSPDLGASATLPSELFETTEDHYQVRAAFNQLAAKDRELLELRVIAGLSPEQVAAAIGKRPGAVRTAQSRALARLRQRLERR